MSPDGQRLAWICWEHPQMPWDGTVLRVADLAGGTATNVRDLAGSATESVLQPEWLDNGTLVYASDRTGWWNLHAHPLGGEPRPLCPREEEFAGPLWQVGTSWYKVLDGHRLLVSHGTSTTALGVLDTASGTLTDVDLPFTRVLPSAIVPVPGPTAQAGFRALVTASSPTEGDGLRLVEAGADGTRTLNVRLALAERPDPGAVPAVRTMDFAGPDGPCTRTSTSHGWRATPVRREKGRRSSRLCTAAPPRRPTPRCRSASPTTPAGASASST